MSGGNLTYPIERSFRNTLVNTDFRGYVDLNGLKHLLNTNTGYDMIAGSASWSLIGAMAATKKVVGVNLNDDYPILNGTTYDYGFSIKTLANEPGVFNDLPRGMIKSYFGTTSRLDAAVSGRISTAEMTKQVDDVYNAIIADNGLGNYGTAVVGALVDVTKNGLGIVATGGAIGVDVICDGETYTVVTAADVDAAVTAINGNGAFYAKAHAFNMNGRLVVVPVDPSKSVTADNYVHAEAQGYPVLVLRTKAAYYEDYTFQVESDYQDGSFFGVVDPGNFAHKGLSSDDVYRQFAHKRNLGKYAMMTRQTLPADQTWEKYVIKSKLSTASIHGASHNEDYEMVQELFTPASSSDTAGFKWVAADGSTETTVTWANLLAWFVA